MQLPHFDFAALGLTSAALAEHVVLAIAQRVLSELGDDIGAHVNVMMRCPVVVELRCRSSSACSYGVDVAQWWYYSMSAL